MGLNPWQFVSGNGILCYRILHLSLRCDSSNLCNTISNTKSSNHNRHVILRVYLIQLYDVDAVEFRTRTLIHCDALLYIDMGGGHKVRPVCPYWLRANAADRSVEDRDGHVCSFACVPNRFLGEDLENIIYWLAPNDAFGYTIGGSRGCCWHVPPPRSRFFRFDIQIFET